MGHRDAGMREQHSSKRGATAPSCSSCLKAEGEIMDREKEIKEDEGQKGKKTGQVFSTCLLAEQSYFRDPLGHLKQKQLMTCSPAPGTWRLLGAVV